MLVNCSGLERGKNIAGQKFLAQGSPSELRGRTGVDDLEEVFLRLVDAGPSDGQLEMSARA